MRKGRREGVREEGGELTLQLQSLLAVTHGQQPCPKLAYENSNTSTEGVSTESRTCASTQLLKSTTRHVGKVQLDMWVYSGNTLKGYIL